ncbi:hypothetical protein [Spirosoma agri]|uniref:Uncharacterized protein n=1 Tax=Spirosoma agri TaxID=1987381 RepID=A0A6M0IIN5_9BACT|nr:hypothetical protein [Spirosoma agri]NEU68109.1 hypothetical protein [Spirosoma agri]
MPTFIAEIASYSVLFEHGNSPNRSPFRNRFIQLRFTANAGMLAFYSLNFVPESKHASTGTIEKQANGSFRGNTTIPIGEFPQYYDVLRTEKPVSVRIEFDDDPQTALVGELLPLTFFTLFTGAEPPGEGLPDVSK